MNLYLPTFVVAMLVLAPPAQTDATVKLTTAKDARYGAYVADAQGRALYVFEADRQAKGSTPAESRCDDACAAAWPPLVLKQGKTDVGPGLDSNLTGSIIRKDGSQQVTYGGWPLYYFAKDRGPGSVSGQDVHGFGGGWYLVAPDGRGIAGRR